MFRPGSLLLSPVTRPVRFATTGGIAALVQLSLLLTATRRGFPAVPSNAAAFLVAAQVNFLLSSLVTWRDRGGSWPRRWLLYHLSISATALLNLAIFTLAQTVLPLVIASLTGSAAAAVANYVIGDRVVFSGRTTPRMRMSPGTGPS